MKLGIIVLVIGLLLNILETWYFGWNMEAKSTAEAYADLITNIIMVIGGSMILIAFGIREILKG